MTTEFQHAANEIDARFWVWVCEECEAFEQTLDTLGGEAWEQALEAKALEFLDRNPELWRDRNLDRDQLAGWIVLTELMQR
jgi:hypothetical protein